MIKARAIVDIVRKVDIGLNIFKVEVWGEEPYDYMRVYEIAAKNDNVAAQEGIRRFVKEMESIVETKA
jgi:hypothetical protein